MPDYSKSKIYKIVSASKPELVYIGSTTQPLKKRFNQHRSSYNQYKKGLSNYVTSFKLFECDDAEIKLIKNVCCETRKELEKLEGEIILNTICCNKYVAGRTNKAYYQSNKSKIKEKANAYYQSNKDIIKAKNKVKAKAYYQKNKARKKAYYQKNKEQIRARQRARYKLKKI